MKSVLSILSLLFFVPIVGCHHATEVSGYHGSWTVPKPGSMFVFSSPTLAPDTVFIRANDVRIGGKSEVVAFDSVPNYEHATGFIAYEDNGDISIGDSSYNWTIQDGYGVYGWKRYPTATHAPFVMRWSDTSINNVQYHLERTVSFVGIDTLTLAGERLVTIHDLDVFKTTRNGVSDEYDSFDMWFAPSLGFMVKMHDNYDPTTQFDRELSSYHLQ
jgi:hypothetical protein